MNYGIDYGMRQTNIDRATGIRYGVIPANDLNPEVWHESAEADYGAPCCPKCGDEASESPSTTAQGKGYVSVSFDPPDDYETSGCGEYYCDSCRYAFDSDEAFGDEPCGWTLDDSEYKASQGGNDCDIFVLSSPYYTHAQFCSPCARAPATCAIPLISLDLGATALVLIGLTSSAHAPIASIA